MPQSLTKRWDLFLDWKVYYSNVYTGSYSWTIGINGTQGLDTYGLCKTFNRVSTSGGSNDQNGGSNDDDDEDQSGDEYDGDGWYPLDEENQ